MKLFYRKLGQGQPLIILHGLFGSSDNWLSIAKQLAEHFEVFLVDQRNHGLSPHSDSWDYQAMSTDLHELMLDHQIINPVLIGHSMGGKTVMQFAVEHPERIHKLIVVDIAPKYYPVHHREIIDALLSLNLNRIQSRKEAEEALSKTIPDFGTRQFLLKNLYWLEQENEQEKKLAWRFNLDVINKNLESVGEIVALNQQHCLVPTLFMRGATSTYILDNDTPFIKELFPNAELITIPSAGHWIHADQPAAFVESVIRFVQA